MKRADEIDLNDIKSKIDWAGMADEMLKSKIDLSWMNDIKSKGEKIDYGPLHAHTKQSSMSLMNDMVKSKIDWTGLADEILKTNSDLSLMNDMKSKSDNEQ